MSTATITKHALADALKKCMQEDPFEKVTVAAICRRCDLNRKSFYYHFQDKYELVNWIFDQEIGDLLFDELLTTKPPSELVFMLCTYFGENRSFYSDLLRMYEPPSFRHHFEERLSPLLERILNMEAAKLVADPREISSLVSDFCLSALYRWLTRIPPTSAETFLEDLTTVGIILATHVLTLLDN